MGNFKVIIYLPVYTKNARTGRVTVYGYCMMAYFARLGRGSEFTAMEPGAGGMFPFKEGLLCWQVLRAASRGPRTPSRLRGQVVGKRAQTSISRGYGGGLGGDVKRVDRGWVRTVAATVEWTAPRNVWGGSMPRTGGVWEPMGLVCHSLGSLHDIRREMKQGRRRATQSAGCLRCEILFRRVEQLNMQDRQMAGRQVPYRKRQFSAEKSGRGRRTGRAGGGLGT